MKYNFKEYEKMIVQLNLNKSKRVMIITVLIGTIIIFIANYVQDKDFWFSLIFSLIMGMFLCFIFNSVIKSGAKKANLVNKIIEVEQIIDEEKITLKVIKEGNAENSGEYKYEDIIKMREDKYNFYLYITSMAAIIISKKEVENIDEFRQKVLEKMKKEKIS